MKVLFVSSGNSTNGISPIVKRQGDSLSSEGLDIHFFTIKGKGLKGYLSNLKLLRGCLKKLKPDVIHAHYSMSAFLATLAGSKPLAVSLMGSDIKSSPILKVLIRFFANYYWSHTIVKSSEMRGNLGKNNISIIPNGVDTSFFYPMDKSECKKKLGWAASDIHLLFAGNPSRIEKNFSLAKQAFRLQENESHLMLHKLEDVSPEQMPTWMNAADVVLLTSLWEGSPNVVKEAMACNCPVVATDVGDVRWLFGKEPGYYISGFNPDEVAKMIKQAIDFAKKNGATNGKQRIQEIGLDTKDVAKKLISIYKAVLVKQ